MEIGKSGLPASSDRLLSKKEPVKTTLRLFVAGLSPRSLLTIDTLRKLCEDRMNGNYQLEIIDIYQQPELARQHQIIATPTLVKYQPEPQRIMIGNLTRTDRILACLGLPVL